MNVTIFGGTGGLGSKILRDSGYKTDRLGSKDVDLWEHASVAGYFFTHKPEVVIFFSAMNKNSFLHKYGTGDQTDLIQTNITGVTQATTLALQHMREKGWGRIIYASSITVDKNIVGTSMYAATKAYYENIVKTIALENASKGITANCIQLGYMDGGLTYTLDPEFLKNKIQEIPAKRLGRIDEIDSTIEFLINNEYVNGATIKLTGGL
jgi:acetoacetyl-CoA reductase